MRKKIKYLILSSLLFLSVFANLQANISQNNKTSTTAKNCKEFTLIDNSQDLNPIFSPLQNEPRNSFSFDFVEVKDLEENEDKLSSKENSLHFSKHLLAIFYSHISKKASQEQKVNSYTHHHSFSNESLRLHAKYQVFLI